MRPAIVDSFVDAAPTGWSAVLPDLHESADDISRDSWSHAAVTLHINQKEMGAVRLALLSLAPIVQDRVVRMKITLLRSRYWAGFAHASLLRCLEYRALWAVLDSLHVQLQVVRGISIQGQDKGI